MKNLPTTLATLLIGAAAILGAAPLAHAAESDPQPAKEKRVKEDGDHDLPRSTHTVVGTDGDDEMQGTDGSDILSGEDGDDHINGGDGDDELSGGAGDDHIQGAGGNDKIIGGIGNDRINGGEGDDTIRGGDGDDHVNAGDGNDRVYGGDGNDLLECNPGKDDITGGAGDDVIIGGEDGDQMRGNEGADTFIWLAAHNTGGVDVIEDFDISEGDKLDFTEMLARHGYHGDGSWKSVAGYLRAEGWRIQYDPSGKGTAYADLVELQNVKPDLQKWLASGNLIVVGGGKKGD